MSKIFLKHFEREFKLAAKQTEGRVLVTLLDGKCRQPKEIFPFLIRALKNALAGGEKNLRRVGKKEFRELWRHGYKRTTSLDHELAFAVEWFRDVVPTLNAFRQCATTVESAVLRGDFDHAIALVRKQRKLFGWSVWSVELEAALIAEYEGSDEAKKYLSLLAEMASPRLASLLATILKDRCDESISLGAFIAKCDRSFPNLRVPTATQDYLYYRAYGYLRETELSASAVLTMSCTNSVIDYYEAFIDICAAYVCDAADQNQNILIIGYCEQLLEMGIDDFRLKKVIWLAGGGYPAAECSNGALAVGHRIAQSFFSAHSVAVPGVDPEFTSSLFETIGEINSTGTSAQVSLNKLYLTGTRHRGLNFGISIAGFANRVNGYAAEYIASPWGAFSSDETLIAELLSLDLDQSLKMVANYAAMQESNGFSPACADLISALEHPTERNVSGKTDIELIWLARQLLRRENGVGFRNVMIVLNARSTIRAQQKVALQCLSLIASGNLSHVMELMSVTLIERPANRRELPLIAAFTDVRWSELKNFDIIAVGIVAHHAHLLLDDPDSRYIVRMACRAYHKQRPKSDEIARAHASLTGDDQARLVEFLREIWIEDNLTMAGFQSTQEVREDRIQMLQILLQIDPVRSLGYRDEIKELTFEQNLWKGLKHINETRIFVNEAAIARWSEKELSHEFQRWHSLRSEKKSTTPITDDIVLKYLVGHNVSGIFSQFAYTSVTEADTVLMNLIDRLLNRFLMDPADGLNCYLSSRIRHGTLKGTLLGPSEEAGLVGQSDFALRSEPALMAIAPEYLDFAISSIRQFETKLAAIVTRLITEDVQVRGPISPNGRIYAMLNPEFGLAPIASLAEEMHFSSFVATCFELFWSILSVSLAEVSAFFREDVKTEIQMAFDDLIDGFKRTDPSFLGLTTTLRAVATATQTQCDMISNWFSPNRSLQQQEFSLKEAIEIARKATRNVYRAFPDELTIEENESLATPLTPLGLSAVTDCLYVLFENAWKHSGLAPDLPTVLVQTSLGSDADVLMLTISNAISGSRREELENGGLQLLIEKYITNASVEMIPREGGSGLAKIVRMTRRVNSKTYPVPVSIRLEPDVGLSITIHLPIYERAGAYDAYFE